jgi:hypothetical protein
MDATKKWPVAQTQKERQQILALVAAIEAIAGTEGQFYKHLKNYLLSRL